MVDLASEWLERLPDHPIFTTPPASSSALDKSANQPLACRKNTFSIADLDDSGDDDEEGQALDATAKGEDAVPQRKQRMVVRAGKELIVAIGKEIRIMNLQDAKSKRNVDATYWVSPWCAIFVVDSANIYS